MPVSTVTILCRRQGSRKTTHHQASEAAVQLPDGGFDEEIHPVVRSSRPSAPVFAQPGSGRDMGSPTYVTAPRSAEDQAITDAVIQRIEADLISAGSASTPCNVVALRPRRNDDAGRARDARREKRAGRARGRQPAALASGRIALREDSGWPHDGRPEGYCLAASARISYERRRSFRSNASEATINSSAPVISTIFFRFCATRSGPPTTMSAMRSATA